MTLPDSPACEVNYRISPQDIASPGSFPLERWKQFVADPDGLTRDDVLALVEQRFRSWLAIQDREASHA
jgi:hypothetical protein